MFLPLVEVTGQIAIRVLFPLAEVSGLELCVRAFTSRRNYQACISVN